MFLTLSFRRIRSSLLVAASHYFSVKGKLSITPRFFVLEEPLEQCFSTDGPLGCPQDVHCIWQLTDIDYVILNWLKIQNEQFNQNK